MTITPITAGKGRSARKDRGRERALQYPRPAAKPAAVPAPRPATKPATGLEYVAAVEAEIRTNLAQAEAWPEHAEFFTAEANRLRDQLGGTSARKAA